MGVQVSPWSLFLQAGRCPADPHKVRAPGSIPGPATTGRASARPRFMASVGQVRLLGPALAAEYANPEKRPSREGGDFVGSTPTSANGAAPAVPLRCLSVAALHNAPSKQRYGIDTRRHRSRSRGPAATTPASRAGNHGSSPCGITRGARLSCLWRICSIAARPNGNVRLISPTLTRCRR